MRWTRFLFAAVLVLISVVTGGNSPAQEYSLSDLFRIGIENSNRVKISAENIVIAETGKSKALSALIPRLTAFGSYAQFDRAKVLAPPQQSVVIQPNDQSGWGVRADQAFTINGRELTGYSIAKGNIEKNRFDYEAVREDYLISIAGAYFDVLKAQKGLEIAEANLDRITTYRDAAKTRLRIGEVTKTALLRAEGELSGALSERIRARNLLELARVVLVRVVGIPPGFTLKEGKYEDPAATLDQALKTALAQRAELKSLELQKKIADDQVRYAKGAYWPQLGLTAVYSGADQHPLGVTFSTDSQYVGASINFPFYEGGLRNAEVREARAKLKQSELLYGDTIQNVAVEVQNAYLDLETQKGMLQFLGDQLSFARDNYEAVSRQFDFGLASSLDVLDANNLLLTSERQLADAVYNYQVAILRLERATGGLQKLVLK
jgi:outer membrane protein